MAQAGGGGPARSPGRASRRGPLPGCVLALVVLVAMVDGADGLRSRCKLRCGEYTGVTGGWGHACWVTDAGPEEGRTQCMVGEIEVWGVGGIV